MEHPLKNADWDSIRLFVSIADSGSFRKSADALGISVNTARRTMQRLEDLVGFQMFFREAEGARLTPEGRRLAPAARDVAKSVDDLWRIADASRDSMAGPVRVAITEGLGTFWITPQLVSFLDDSHNRVELQCAMRSVDVLRLEADISIQLVEPERPDLIKKRLGFLHLIPFASPEYLARFGRPSHFADLVKHRIVEQQTDQLQGYDLERMFPAETVAQMVRLKTNFSSAHYWAIAKGAGIGLLPNYAPAIGGRVEAVDLGMVFRVPIWMASHPEVIKTARHRRFIDWLTDCFDARRYPWFGETALFPNDIAALSESQQLHDYFAGFVPAPPGLKTDVA